MPGGRAGTLEDARFVDSPWQGGTLMGMAMLSRSRHDAVKWVTATSP
jgi:hypothetical protein